MKAKKFNQRILRAGKGSYFYIEIMILYSLFAKKYLPSCFEAQTVT